MRSSLSKQQIDRLVQFQGYGNPRGRVWFIGIEEGGGGENNLRNRLHPDFAPIMDNHKAHELLGIHQYHTGKRLRQPTWWTMSKVMLGLDEGKLNPKSDELRSYQADRLGRKDGNTFLTELFPIPKPEANKWQEEYEELLGYESLENYQNEVRNVRIDLLKRMLKEYEPRYVVAYGKACWPDFEKVFEEQFEPNGIFKIAKTRAGTSIVLTHHLTAKTMNGQVPVLIQLLKAL